MTEPRPAGPVLLDQDQAEPEPQTYAPIFLRQHKSFRLSRLARFLGLEVYSPVLLTRKVRVELSILAVVLITVFAFELLAWSFFFNGLFTGDITAFHWLGTTAAVVMGFLFAGIILYFERQVVTADSHGLGRFRKVCAAGTRVVFILMAGYIVAHAVDLLVFRIPIAKVLHQEAVAEESLRLAQDLEVLHEKISPERRESLDRKLAKAQQDLGAAEEARIRALAGRDGSRERTQVLRRELAGAKNSLERAEQTFAQLEPEQDRTEALRAIDRAQRRYDRILSELLSATNQDGQLGTTASQLDQRINDLREEEIQLGAEKEEIETKQDLASFLWAKLDERRRAWIKELEQAEPGNRVEDWQGFSDELSPKDESSAEVFELVPARWREPLRFEEPERSFFEELEALYAVVLEIPQGPWWKEPYLVSAIGVHLAAIFIPFLVLCIKWILMPKEVDAYYSASAQARAGDSDAHLMARVEQAVRNERQQGKEQ